MSMSEPRYVFQVQGVLLLGVSEIQCVLLLFSLKIQALSLPMFAIYGVQQNRSAAESKGN
jgi:hypothetical protein